MSSSSISIFDFEGVIVERDAEKRTAVIVTRDYGRVFCGSECFSADVQLGAWLRVLIADPVQPSAPLDDPTCRWLVRTSMQPIEPRLPTTVLARSDSPGKDEDCVEISCPVVMGSVRDQHGIAWSGLGRVYVPRDRVPIMRTPGSAFEVAIVSVPPVASNGECSWEVTRVFDSTVFDVKCMSVVVTGFDHNLNLCLADAVDGGAAVSFAPSDWFAQSTNTLKEGKKLKAWVGAHSSNPVQSNDDPIRSFYVYDPMGSELLKTPSTAPNVHSSTVDEARLMKSATMYEPRDRSYVTISGTDLVRQMMEDSAAFADLLQHDPKLLTELVELNVASK